MQFFSCLKWLHHIFNLQSPDFSAAQLLAQHSAFVMPGDAQ
jgi:hypothetical protein